VNPVAVTAERTMQFSGAAVTVTVTVVEAVGEAVAWS
jgi:hypothetical protein